MLEPAAKPADSATAMDPELSRDWLAALRRGDELVFGRVFDSYQAALVRFATHYVADHAAAEEVAQETWIAFVQGLDRFEGRSSLKTWLFRTLLNCARNRKRKDVRSVPFSAAFAAEASDEPSVDAARFRAEGPWTGHWAVAPRSFEADGERALLRQELQARIQRAVEALAPAQREVLSLRDIEGLTAEETCEVLGVSDVNQRVLLHRARSRVRAEVERYLHADLGQST